MAKLAAMIISAYKIDRQGESIPGRPEADAAHMFEGRCRGNRAFVYDFIAETLAVAF
ncbi:hypothetical protein Y888_11665 [Mixta calida B021323]|nr:hypothetical protein Y888_11665 [Mixta calida B021323]